MGRKHRGKRRNCSSQTISPFPTVLERLVLQTRKNQGLFGKGLRQIMSLDVRGEGNMDEFPIHNTSS